MKGDELRADPQKAAQDYLAKTKIFLIMHLIGIRRDLAAPHPWLAVALFKALIAAEYCASDQLIDTLATKVALSVVDRDTVLNVENNWRQFLTYGTGGQS